MMAHRETLIVIGIGNPFRGDDGAGWAVVDALQNKVRSGVKLCKLKGDIAELLDVFANYATVYLVDSCISDSTPGSWERIDGLLAPLFIDRPQTSTHGLSISQAIALAKNLHQLPSKLILYAIYGNRYHLSTSLSPAVAQAIDQVTQTILNEKDIQRCMNKA